MITRKEATDSEVQAFMKKRSDKEISEALGCSIRSASEYKRHAKNGNVYDKHKLILADKHENGEIDLYK